MKKLSFLIVCIMPAFCSFSQNALQDPVSAKFFNSEKYTGIRGTPFLMDKWLKGNVSTPRGVYQGLDLKYNVYDNSLFFNKDDESFEFQDEIVSFTLMPKEDPATHLIYKRGISGADLRENQFVQVLLEGKMSLYKLDVKQLTEISEINAGIVKTFANTAKYYIGKNKDLQFIKINKTEVLNALKDKQSQVEAFINEKKLSFRKDADVIEVLKYYNSL